MQLKAVKKCEILPPPPPPSIPMIGSYCIQTFSKVTNFANFEFSLIHYSQEARPFGAVLCSWEDSHFPPVFLFIHCLSSICEFLGFHFSKRFLSLELIFLSSHHHHFHQHYHFWAFLKLINLDSNFNLYM